MIDPKTLHVGSHVLVSGVRARVTDIEAGYPVGDSSYGAEKIFLLRFSAIINGQHHTCGSPSNADGIEPILITSSLLKELGFDGREDAWHKYFDSEQWVTLYKDKKSDDYEVLIHSFPSIKAVVDCKYLHELEMYLYLTLQVELLPESEVNFI